MVALLGSCKDENVEVVGVCPIVVSTNPVNLTTGIHLNQVVTVTFNEKMNPATITPDCFSLQGETKSTGANVAGTLTYDVATNTMRFTPTDNLTINTTYTGRVFTTVRDLMGNALQVHYDAKSRGRHPPTSPVPAA